MMRWVETNQNWILRPTVEGLELISRDGEQVIAFELKGSETDVSECISIFRGEKPFRSGEENLEKLFVDLSKHGAITLSENQPVDFQIKESSENLKRLWQVRSKFVGTNTPIPKVYWCDPSLSRFFEMDTPLFSSQYTEGGIGTKYKTNWSTGISDDLELAELKSIMEALERHISGIIPYADLIKSSANKIDKQAIDPRRVALYKQRQHSKKEFPLIPFSEDREYYWKEVMTFPGRKKRYLPIECLYFPINTEFTPQPYTLANSSGVAAGFSFRDALLRGLYEVIERDAFMVAWVNRIIKPIIQKTSLSDKEQERMEEIKKLGYQIYCVDLTLDIAPVMLVIAVSHQQKPSLVLGAASNLNVNKAISKALAEVEKQLYWDLREPNKIQILSNPKQVRGVSDHMALYATSEHLEKASFLWQGNIQPLEVSSRVSGDELKILLNLLSVGKKEVITADLSSSLLKKAGIWVIRTIVLGLVPISFGYGMEPLGMPRLKKLSTQKNPWPENLPFIHPFA